MEIAVQGIQGILQGILRHDLYSPQQVSYHPKISKIVQLSASFSHTYTRLVKKISA